MNYRDTVCIVTGASSGIGAAFAVELASRGAKVVLFARRRALLEQIAGGLPSGSPGEALVVAGDVTLAADRERLLAETLARWGRLDVLVNNAGRMGGGRFDGLDAAEIDRLAGLNLVSMMQLTRLALPHLMQAERGLILNVSSAAGDLAIPEQAVYSATKAGMSAFSLALYRELKASRVHVMTLLPGYTASEMAYTDAQTAKLRALKPAAARTVAAQALDAAARGRVRYSTSRGVGVLVWLNRMFPRLMDRVLPRLM